MSTDAFAALAGNFLNAFTQSRNSKELRNQQEEQNKLILKLMEQQLATEEDRKSAAQFVVDRMASKAMPQLQETGGTTGSIDSIPNLQQTGSRDIPGMSLLDMLVTHPSELMQSGMMPQIAQTEGMRNRQELMAGLSSSDDPQAFLQGEGSPLAIGSGFSPTEIFPSQRGDPASIAIAKSFGLEPGTPEFRELVERMEFQGAEQIELLSSQMDLMRSELQLYQMQREIEGLNRTENETVEDTVEAIESIAGSLDKLEGSFLTPGVPASEGRAALYSIGQFASSITGLGDADAMNEKLTAYGEFQKGTADLVNMLQSRMSANGIQMTNQAREMIQNASASDYLNPEANRAVLVRLLNDALRDAERLDFSPSDLNKMRTLRARLESGHVEAEVGQKINVGGIEVTRVE